ncbi:DUF1800 domain-containing protein [Sphingomonas sp. AR_OL41]|uniref:DUF1800 domain-containing protein n=1 Tax=Sphingomonas sp. AR_OL41 TaxID=3042729 RepID=UPI002481624E|nr:DUF1800 domain-containing protein [Sphingomonas sp. AR_OL41]MDH7971383.1 DUF1800 domain-containing protein [Sphingomonas sp. AR_OL41]
MAQTSIAMNRFGLGARPDEPAPDNPSAWLLDQFARFDPRPTAIAAAPDSRAVSQELAQYLEEQRQLRQQFGPARKAAPGPAMTESPASQQMTQGMTATPAPEMPARRDDPIAQARQFARRQGRDDYAAAVGARMSTALVTPAPFVERLVHFWANHFAVSADKLTVVGLSGTLEFEAIRPHVLGTFGDMLGAVERHPAMLLYLDQAQSVGPNSMIGTRVAARGKRKVGLNENLAREIMELHTLGVRTGYSQADVTEFARAMTGWTVSGLGRAPGARFTGTDGPAGAFVFAGPLHEPGARSIMGKRYDQPGVRQAQAVLDDLARHPATAAHIATKLARHFAGDTPPPALVERLQASFLKTGGDLPSLYRVLVEAPEAWAPQPAKFKTPWEWTVSSMRALGVKTVQPLVVTGLLNQLGQPTWKPGSPAGYDDIAASWAGPDAIMRRVEASERFASRANGIIDARVLAPKLFPAALSSATSQALANAESPGQGLALLLVAPEFMRR